MEEDKKLSFFFLGLGVGVAVGLLWAPKSGEETRSLIRDKAGEGKEYVRRRTGDLRETASEYADRSRTVLAKQKETIASAIDAGKQAYRDATTERRPASQSDPANEGV